MRIISFVCLGIILTSCIRIRDSNLKEIQGNWLYQDQSKKEMFSIQGDNFTFSSTYLKNQTVSIFSCKIRSSNSEYILFDEKFDIIINISVRRGHSLDVLLVEGKSFKRTD